MGVWDAIYYTGDLVKGAGSATYRYTSAAAIKVNEVVRVDDIQKLSQYWPDDATRSQIALFTTTFCKNAGKYAVYEGFKHFPGGTVASKLVKDTMREMKQGNQKDGMKAMDRLEKDLTSQPGNSSKIMNLNPQNAGGGEAEKTKDMINMFMKTEFVGNHMFNDLMVPLMKKKSE